MTVWLGEENKNIIYIIDIIETIQTVHWKRESTLQGEGYNIRKTTLLHEIFATQLVSRFCGKHKVMVN